MIEPVTIIEESDSELSIEWSDGSSSVFLAPEMRRVCPCAGCVNEWTGEKMLDPDSISSDVVFSHISVVGRYALNFHFSDGHETGIFSFNFLHNLSELES
ncbi:MAG: DUF971 domain-containing protein [Pyrinomonadaceae bacterium]